MNLHAFFMDVKSTLLM